MTQFFGFDFGHQEPIETELDEILSRHGARCVLETLADRMELSASRWRTQMADLECTLPMIKTMVHEKMDAVRNVRKAAECLDIER